MKGNGMKRKTARGEKIGREKGNGMKRDVGEEEDERKETG